MAKLQNLETVTAVEHFTDDLFWFRTTKKGEWKRPFRPGEFVMIGMGDDDRSEEHTTEPQ